MFLTIVRDGKQTQQEIDRDGIRAERVLPVPPWPAWLANEAPPLAESDREPDIELVSAPDVPAESRGFMPVEDLPAFVTQFFADIPQRDL